MESAGTSTEMTALKTRLRATWIAGDFGQIAKYYTRDAADFINRLNLKPGMKVLDVACGTGNTALPAARAGADVTGVDLAPNLVEQARENAKREGLNARFEEGDAEALPYEDASLPSRRSHSDGKLNTRRFYWTDVQDDVVARHASGGYAVSGDVGSGGKCARAFRRRHLEAGDKASNRPVVVSFLSRPGSGALPRVLWSDAESVWYAR